MTWYIEDFDRWTIYATNLWSEYFIPKFQIKFSIDEPYLTIYWTDLQNGGNSLQRQIVIDYQDVVGGYYPEMPVPTSAEDLMGIIIDMQNSAWTDISGGGDLPDDVIDALLNADSPDAVNTFVTQNELLAALTVSQTFLTPELFADGNTTGTGANQFLDDLGYDDAEAATTWPLTAANYPGGLTAAGFTLDAVCWNEMYFFGKENGMSAFCTPGGKAYYVNKTIYLPRIMDLASNRTSLTFQTDFRGAIVRNSSGGDMILFDRYPDDQDDADTLLSYQYCFWNGVIRGNGGTDENDTLFRIGATSRCEFRNMNMFHAGRITDLQFCLEPVFDNINISDYVQYGLMVRNGQWVDAGFFNAQSNVPKFGAFRSYNSPGNTPVAAIYCEGNHSIRGDVFTFEGDVGSQHHFFYDNDGSAGVQLGKIESIYMEFAGCTRAGIRVKAGKGEFEIGTFRSSVVEADMPVLIEADNDRTPTSSIHMVLRDSANSAIGSKLRAVGDPDYPVKWYVYRVRMNDNLTLNVSDNFETGVIANSYIPDNDDVIFEPPL